AGEPWGSTLASPGAARWRALGQHAGEPWGSTLASPGAARWRALGQHAGEPWGSTLASPGAARWRALGQHAGEPWGSTLASPGAGQRPDDQARHDRSHDLILACGRPLVLYGGVKPHANRPAVLSPGPCLSLSGPV